MSPTLDGANSNRTQQFCSPFSDTCEHFVVRLEEVATDVFEVHYGVYPDLDRYPTRGKGLWKLEAIQFLGKLWGGDYKMPEQVKGAYIIWLRGIEKQFLEDLSKSGK
jgi:hypothetical protein